MKTRRAAHMLAAVIAVLAFATVGAFVLSVGLIAFIELLQGGP